MSQASPDAELLARLRQGEEAAAEALVRTHAGWMRALALRMLGDADADAADDCVQESFINAFRHIDGFKGDAALKTWLHRITVNAALMRLRKRKRLNERPIDDLQPEYDAADHRINESHQQLASPAEILENEDRRQQVLAAISQLPKNYRIVLLLRDIQEMSTAQVAEQLDMSEANVKVRLHRGRAALKTLLEPVLRREAG